MRVYISLLRRYYKPAHATTYLIIIIIWANICDGLVNKLYLIMRLNDLIIHISTIGLSESYSLGKHFLATLNRFIQELSRAFTRTCT